MAAAFSFPGGEQNMVAANCGGDHQNMVATNCGGEQNMVATICGGDCYITYVIYPGEGKGAFHICPLFFPVCTSTRREMVDVYLAYLRKGGGL